MEFAKAVAAERESSGYPPSEWQAAGRWNDQGEDFWRENGPVYAQNFITWFESQEDVSVWIAPDGRPAIELDLTADFGGVPVRGIVDVVLAIGTANPALVVTDYKSGGTAPNSARQLAIGASLVEAVYGIRPRYGAFFMARKAPKALLPMEMNRPEHSLAYLSGEFRFLDLAVEHEIYPANPGDHCRRCPVAHACVETGGDKARLYDPNYPAHVANPRRTRL